MSIYSIKDVKIGYGMPFMLVNDLVATRTFTELINDTSTEVSKHPLDMELWKVGEWDEATGTITPMPVPVFMIGGKDVKE